MTDKQFDVVVIGFGDAGASAAIEAADGGAKVLVIDTDYGGGASALSAGVVYAGGGTSVQVENRVEDSVDKMYAYLRQEVTSAVEETTLRRFCEQSPQMIEWLKGHDVPFAGGTPPYKTSLPDRRFLSLLLRQ